MVTIDITALPTPAEATVRSMQVRLQSARGPLMFTHRPDAFVNPRQVTLTYRDLLAPQADALRRHWNEHATAVFEITLPRTGEVILVQWAGAPQIQWATPRSASVTAEFAEVLAHE